MLPKTSKRVAARSAATLFEVLCPDAVGGSYIFTIKPKIELRREAPQLYFGLVLT
ncbi:hypothetical protein [Pseudanabaena sp. UWO310]|uniref:hypothetical protein n=1 Tax=Pseudanabaena sp. UWO310 TaxID=2480795 RepID=UPI00168076C9|nr:hypothetical protein [Pseudanabaena sp. UWO310]